MKKDLSKAIKPTKKVDLNALFLATGIDFTAARKEADELRNISDNLTYDDSHGLVGIAKTLLCVNFIIGQETGWGNDDLDGSLARDLGLLVGRAADQIQEIVSRLAEK